MFKSLVGISFLEIICDILLCKSNYKKNVKTVIGILSVAIIIGEFANIKDIKIDTSIIEEAEIIAENNYNIASKDITKKVVDTVGKNICNDLIGNGIIVRDVKIEIDGDYNITMLKLYGTEKIENQNVLNMLEEKYNVGEDKIYYD